MGMKNGRVDILLETSLFSTHLASPHIGHLEPVFPYFWISQGQLKAQARILSLPTEYRHQSIP